MRLQKCEWSMDCVWREDNPNYLKKYKIGHKKATFRIKVSGNEYRYSCEGCVREILGEEKYETLRKEIIPLTERAKQVLFLLKL